MHKSRILVNVLVSILQVVVNGIVFLVLYRYLYGAIGLEDVGIWALVLNYTSVSHLANLGMVGSAVKFVAAHRARGADDHAADIVQTTVLTMAVVLAVVLAIAYVPLHLVIGAVVDTPEKVPLAQSVLPYALVSFWLTSMGGVFCSSIEGCERVDLRHVLMMGAALAYLGLAFLLVPEYGLIGLARAQVAQAAGLALVAWLTLRRLLPPLPIVPIRWRRPVFREVLGYSVNFQVVTVAQLLTEPIVRTLTTHFGGLAATGAFEYAYKMVFQIRLLIATAHQALVPTLAVLHVQAPDRLRSIYTASFRTILFLVLPALPFLIAVTPVIARLWLQDYEPAFVLYADILFVAWFLNLFSNPAYFANLGTGDLRWNVRGAVVTAALNVALGLALGFAFGATGVVLAYATGIIVGAALTLGAYQRDHHIPVSDLIDRPTLVLGLASGVGGAVTVGLYRVMADWPALSLGLILAAAYLAIVGIPLWRHPVRAQLMSWAGTFLRRRQTPASSTTSHS